MSNPLLCHDIHSAARLFYLLLKAFSVLALRASLSPTALDRKEGYLLSTTHSVHWCQNLVSIQALNAYEASMGADPFDMVELRETIPRLLWHNIPRQKPTVWFTEWNSWMRVRSPTPPYIFC